MKQMKLFLGLLLIGVMFVSCEKDEIENTDAKLVTKIITTDAEGQKTTSLYEYDGLKIKTITETSDWGKTVFTYTYTGNDISKIVESNEDGIVKSQSFIHVGGKLMSWSENYETDSETCFFCETVAYVTYNKNGSQTVKYVVNAKTEDETVINQVEVDKPSSFQMRTSIVERGSNGITKSFSMSDLIYSPHRNITGWAALERLDLLMYSKYSAVLYVAEGDGIDIYELKYSNFDGFPTEMVAENDFGFRYKKEFFYNK